MTVGSDWVFAHDAPEVLLERVLEAIGRPTELERLQMVVWAQATRRDEPWSALMSAANSLSMRCTVTQASIDEASCLVTPEVLVLGHRRGASAGWVVLRGRVGAHVLVEARSGPPRRVRAAEVSSALGLEGSHEVTQWLVVSAAEPLESMSSGFISKHDPTTELPYGETASPLSRLRALLKVERRDVGVVLVFAVAVGLLTLVTPVVMQVLVNTVAFGTPLQPLVILAILLLGGLGFAAALRSMEAWVVEMIQRRIFLRLVGDLAHRLPRVKASAFDKSHGPELVNRFFDVFTVKKVASWLLLDGLEILMTMLIGMIVLAFYHPLLLAFDVVLIACILWIVFGMGRGASRTSIKESKAKYAMASWLEELVRHQIAFKGAGGARFGLARTDSLARKYLDARQKHFAIVYRQLVMTLGLQALATTGLIALGAWLVMERQLTLGQLVAAELIVSVVVASLTKLAWYLESLYDLIAAVDKLGQLVDLPLERADGHPWVAPRDQQARLGAVPSDEPPARHRGARLKLSGVSFAFSEGRALFKDASLMLEPGDRVAVGGPAGSGKSVLLDLIFGLRQPSAGYLELDGIDLRDLSLNALRDRVAVVRGPEIFEGTVLENVQTGRMEVDLMRVREALRAVGMLETVQQLPNALHTKLASGAPQLSTSQATRLTLARAIAGAPALLAVDEIFGKMSDETAGQVLGSLTDPDAPWTLLTISRDAHIQGFCHRVVRLQDTKLVEAAPSC